MHALIKTLLWPFRAVMRLAVLALERMPVAAEVKRLPEQQARVERELKSLTLYHMWACPFCVKVRRHAKRLGLELEMRDILRDPGADEELVRQGGQDQVPCLKITEPGVAGSRWMYESDEINAYLTQRFGVAENKSS